MSSQRRGLRVAGFAAVGLACVALWLIADQREEPPNLLLVVLDTVRADHLSTYGYARETSPNLSALAASGVRFEQVVSAAPWTVPSHASLMTGLTPAEHGSHHESWRLAPEIPTLAERLRAAGYRTAAVSANPFVGPVSGLDRGFERFTSVTSGGRAVTDAALAFVSEASPRPFFLFVNYMDAHLPYPSTPPEWRTRFLSNVDDATVLMPLQLQQMTGRYACGLASPDPARIERVVGLYDAAIAWLDSLVGELLRGLGDAREDTLVVVLSDHGELLGEHGLVEHQYAIYEPLLRVPLIASLPGRIAAGSVVEAPVSAVALHDLILRWLDPGDEDPLQPAALARQDLVSEYYRPLMFLERLRRQLPDCVSRFDRRLTSVRHGSHKLIWSSDGERQLFDLERDPGEQRDLAAQQPALVDELVRVVESRQRQAAATALRAAAGSPARVDAETRERLEALGYLGEGSDESD
jgi:arylsulfatase A-like enzyme